MNPHDALIRASTAVQLAVQGDAGAATYKPPKKEAIATTAIVGAVMGGSFEADNGDWLNVFRVTIHIPTPELVAGGVTQLERNASVTVLGETWSIDLTESRWGAQLVQLALYRRPIAQHEQMSGPPGVR